MILNQSVKRIDRYNGEVDEWRSETEADHPSAVERPVPFTFLKHLSSTAALSTMVGQQTKDHKTVAAGQVGEL